MVKKKVGILLALVAVMSVGVFAGCGDKESGKEKSSVSDESKDEDEDEEEKDEEKDEDKKDKDDDKKDKDEDEKDEDEDKEDDEKDKDEDEDEDKDDKKDKEDDEDSESADASGSPIDLKNDISFKFEVVTDDYSNDVMVEVQNDSDLPILEAFITYDVDGEDELVIIDNTIMPGKSKSDELLYLDEGEKFNEDDAELIEIDVTVLYKDKEVDVRYDVQLDRYEVYTNE